MNPMHNERGLALTSVLWVVAMLALMAAASGCNTTTHSTFRVAGRSVSNATVE